MADETIPPVHGPRYETSLGEWAAKIEDRIADQDRFIRQLRRDLEKEMVRLRRECGLEGAIEL